VAAPFIVARMAAIAIDVTGLPATLVLLVPLAVLVAAIV
jgi:hypothetical protein